MLSILATNFKEQENFTFTFSIENNFPEIVCWNDVEYLENKERKVLISKGIMKFYFNAKNNAHLAIKFRCIKNINIVTRELNATLKLESYPTDCMLPIIHASMTPNNRFIMLLSKGMCCDLQEWKKLAKIVTYEQVITMMKSVTKALCYLQSLNLVYLDLKLENIVTDLNNHFYLIDFDTLEQAEHKEGLIFSKRGTNGLRSLEQLELKGLSISTDIFSLSIALYEFITNEGSCYYQISNFTDLNKKLCIKKLNEKTSHWLKSEQKHILKLFMAMHEYDCFKRISLPDLAIALISYDQ